MLLMNFRSFVAFSGLSSLSSPRQIPAARHRRNTGSLFKAIVNYCECSWWRVCFWRLGPSTKTIYASDTAYKYLFATYSADSCLCWHWMFVCGFVWVCGYGSVYVCFLHYTCVTICTQRY